MAVNRNFISGFLDSFVRTSQAKKEQDIQAQTRKLQTKLFEKQLEKMDMQSKAEQELGMMQGNAGPEGPQRPKSLLDILADPRGQQLLVQSGAMSPRDIIASQRKSNPFDISQIPPGMVLSGVKVTPDGEPMYDFTIPEVDKWAPSENGLEMVGLDKLGREIARRPAGPDERPKPSEDDKKKKELASALDVYEKAKQGLMKGLSGTVTAPVLGKLPAVTSEQQIAQGSVAAMAPVLKQLFRAAGEGVFTDRDQQLLLEMIPTRETNPEARDAMIKNIDAIVKAKLGMGQQSDTRKKVVKWSDLPQGE